MSADAVLKDIDGDWDLLLLLDLLVNEFLIDVEDDEREDMDKDWLLLDNFLPIYFLIEDSLLDEDRFKWPKESFLLLSIGLRRLILSDKILLCLKELYD